MEPMKIHVFSIGGNGPRCGKDTCGEILMEMFATMDVWAIKISLADALKEELAKILQIDIKDLYTSGIKEKYRKQMITYGAMKRREDRHYWPKKLAEKAWKTYVSGRPHDWANIAVVVPDNRYGQELDLPALMLNAAHAERLHNFYDYKFRARQYAIYVERPDVELRKNFDSKEAAEAILYDASETCLGPLDFSYTIPNDTNLFEFEGRVKEWAKKYVKL